MIKHEDLIARLRALGTQPISPEVSGRHLSAIEGELDSAATDGVRGRRLRIVAAFAVGLLAGTSGLATAGALPDSAQEVAHNTLGAVGVKVPHGARYKGPECGGATNHGQYVRSQPKGDRAKAGASRCGKPLHAGQDGSDSAGGGKPGGDCQGPPPWAGKGKPDKAAKEARRQACGGQEDDNDNKDAPPADPGSGTPNAAPQDPAAAVTTDPPAGDTTIESTTTTTAATTTTTSTTTTGAGPAEEPSSTTTTGTGLATTPPTPPETGLVP